MKNLIEKIKKDIEVTEDFSNLTGDVTKEVKERSEKLACLYFMQDYLAEYIDIDIELLQEIKAELIAGKLIKETGTPF